MRVEDKARLIFADRNKRGDTNGREGLLTPDEEKALIEDAQELRQISELNRLNRLYNISVFMMLDIQTAYLNFRLAEGRLLTILTAMILVGEGSDAFNWVIYDFVTQGYKNGQLEDEKIQEEIDKKTRELRKKYKTTDGLSKIYDYFEPSLRDSSYFSTDDDVMSQPNPLLQKALMQVVREIKAFNKQLYQREYVEAKAGMEFTSEKDKTKIDIFTNEMNELTNLEGCWGLIRMYAEFADKRLIRTKNLAEPKFLKTVKDMEKATRLTEKEKVTAQEEVDNIALRQNQ